jgi:hypothetical protein
MSIQRLLLVLCITSGILLVARAIFVRKNRWHLLIPGVALWLLAAYEYRMDQWEKTVSAPIRLDMMVQIPVVLGFVIWGALAIALSVRNSATKPGRQP